MKTSVISLVLLFVVSSRSSPLALGPAMKWQTWDAPPESVSIVVVDVPGGFGDRHGQRETLSLRASGQGNLVRARRDEQLGALSDSIAFTFNPEGFDSLLQACYDIGFFQLGSGQDAWIGRGDYVERSPDGRMRLVPPLILSHRPRAEIAVNLGAYRKTVSIIPERQHCPTDMLNLYNTVKAFAVRHTAGNVGRRAK